MDALVVMVDVQARLKFFIMALTLATAGAMQGIVTMFTASLSTRSRFVSLVLYKVATSCVFGSASVVSDQVQRLPSLYSSRKSAAL